MKLMLVADRKELKDSSEYHFLPLGFDVVWYRNPVKAMDNFDEVSPHVVIFSSDDFPRHWKPFCSFLRSMKTNEECLFILTSTTELESDEASKFTTLGVSALVTEDFADRVNIQKLEQLFSRYHSIEQNRIKNRYYFDDENALSMVFHHPKSLTLITGLVKDIGPQGLSFLPESPALIADIPVDTMISNASLQLGQKILSVSARIISINKRIGFRIEEITAEDKSILADFLKSRNISAA
jgi:hypothetical protein